MTWVGDWRPHKARGPIGAHFKSPGPKYGLPSALGTAGTHDKRKNIAPSHSFGTKHVEFRGPAGPGPAAYTMKKNFTRKGGDGTAQYSLYDRTKALKPFNVPGPGTYAPESAGQNAHYKAPQYSMSGRNAGLKTDNNPSPNTYSVDAPFKKNSRARSAPRFSFGGRHSIGHFTEDLAKTPGPAVYESVDPSRTKSAAPQYSMTARNNLPGDNTTKPGPGAHSPEKVVVTKNIRPKYSFGVRHSEYTCPLLSAADA